MRWWIAAFALAGCKGDDCVALADGDWTVDGAAFGMLMTGTVAMNADDCTFEFTAWDMPMDSLPTGGSIDGTDVQLDGDSFWKSCSGTVADDATRADGTCENGDDWSMDSAATATFRP
jgi:hypothetical protein